MKNIYELLKFELDSESAQYEFDIIPIPPYELIANNLSLEPYEYFGKEDILFGMKTKQIILYYNADILMKVKITFTGNVIDKIRKSIEGSGLILPDTIQLKIYYNVGINRTIIDYQKKILGNF